MRKILFAVLCAASFSAAHAQLNLSNTIALPGVASKFDHLSIDLKGNRLFVSATGVHAVEVIDLATNKIQQSINGLGKPHGLAWVEATGSLYVSDGALAELRVYKGSPLALAGTIKLSDDADDMVYDDAHHLLFVGHGGSDAANPARVAVVDTAQFKLVANLPVTSHPEALEIDEATNRVFVNISAANEIVVIDTTTQAISAHWKLTNAANNVPLALDDKDHLLFVACRTPGTLIALDAATGRELATASTATGADDLFFNPTLRQVYVITGTGEVDEFSLDKSNALKSIGIIKTAAGAKTALFVEEQNLLYVAIPGTTEKPSEIRVFSPATTGAKQ